jgi:hypothetical protein
MIPSDDKGLPAETLRPGKVEVGEVGWRGTPVDSRKFVIGADMDDVKAGIDVGTGTGVDGVRVTEVGNAGVFRSFCVSRRVGVGDRLGAVAVTFSRYRSRLLLL